MIGVLPREPPPPKVFYQPFKGPEAPPAQKLPGQGEQHLGGGGHGCLPSGYSPTRWGNGPPPLHGRYRALTGKAKALQRELGAATLHFDFTGDDGPDPGPGRASSTSQPAEEVSFRADKLCTCSQPCSHV